ncbi:hypothetical protein COCNU_06G017250 [Cocos nucifera]|uniref:Uncharacterized protein n=1 Tax=Cocos nucifera TaxID=13894 RepID=A0A8K0IE73_COCNU|nr:hypothetical protein COCNU_06G017250 [Cocos nucifera]
MKFGGSEAAELPLELAVEEAPTKKHKVLPTKASQEGGVKFGTRPNSPSSICHQGNPLRRIHRRWNEAWASQAELPLELVVKEVPTKKHEVLP